jgi:copper(I)-binding protein
MTAVSIRLLQRGVPSLLLAVVLALSGLVGCGGGASSGGERLGQSSLWVKQTSARMMPAMSMGAVYFTVENRGGTPDRLLAVASAAAEASLHETLVEDGVSKMRERPQGFVVPARGALTLAPGGPHIMLMGLQSPAPSGTGPAAADVLELVLTFEQAGEHTVQIALPPAP